MKKISEMVEDQSSLFKLTGLRVVPKPIRAPKQKGTNRNYTEEDNDSQLALFNVMADYRVQRNSGVSPRLMQLAKSLILCGLPYRSTQETRIERISREADGTFVRVTFYALARDAQGDSIQMPFGSDRTLLHYGIDKAIKLKSSFVSIDNPTEYLLAIGKTLSGANYAALKGSIRRLSGLSVVVERFAPGKNGHDETRQTLPILEAAYIPSRLEKDPQTPLQCLAVSASANIFSMKSIRTMFPFRGSFSASCPQSHRCRTSFLTCTDAATQPKQQPPCSGNICVIRCGTTTAKAAVYGRGSKRQ